MRRYASQTRHRRSEKKIRKIEVQAERAIVAPVRDESGMYEVEVRNGTAENIRQRGVIDIE